MRMNGKRLALELVIILAIVAAVLFGIYKAVMWYVDVYSYRNSLYSQEQTMLVVEHEADNKAHWNNGGDL